MAIRLLAAFALLVAISPSAAQVPEEFRHGPAEKLGVYLFSELNTKPRSCPESMYSETKFDVMYCGKTRQLKSTETGNPLGLVDEILSPYAPAEGPWVTDGHRHLRVYRLQDVPLTVRLDTRAGVAGFSYPLQGFTCIIDESIPTEDEENLSLPVVLKKVAPVYPLDAVKERKNARVVLEAVVLKDGSVGDVCLFGSSTLDHGFIAAAMEAVRQWRYEPGSRAGEPVEVRFTIVVDFDVSPSSPRRKSRPRP